MTNYEPFREPTPNPNIKERELGKEIFTLRVEGDEARGEKAKGERLKVRGREWTHVFTDNAEADMPRIEVYKARRREGDEAKGEKEWLFRVAIVANAPICCELECNEDFTEGVLHIAADCQDVRFCIDNALMLLFAFRTAPLMTLEMHAAVVVRGDGRGYLFLGHSGTGKSTHARMWLQAFPDTWLLNDDNPILRVMEDGEVRVYGSPWSGKTPCYNNAYARVGGIIKLSQAPHNQIRKLSLPEAYAYILSSASGLKIERQMTDNMYNTIRDIITQVGCYHMECLPNTEAAEVCFSGCKV
jgi:hypothetical protein